MEATELAKVISDAILPYKTEIDKNKEAIKSLEADIKKNGFKGDPETNKKNTEIYKNFIEFVRSGNVIDKNAVIEREGPKGGYLVPEEVYNQILTKYQEGTNIMEYMNKVTVGSNAEIFTIDNGETTVEWVGENEDRNEQKDVTFAQVRIPVNKQSSISYVSNDFLDDSTFDIVGHLSTKVTEAILKEDSNQFLYGDSYNKPQGLLMGKKTPEFNIGTGGATPTIDPDLLLQLPAESGLPYIRKTDYRWIMNWKTYSKIRTLKDASGQYVLNRMIGETGGTFIDQWPIGIVQQMPNIGNPDYPPIVFGNINKAYTIIERAGATLMRDDITKADKDMVKFLWKRRIGGGLVDEDAFVKVVVE